MMNLEENTFEKFSMGRLSIQTVSADGLMIEGAQVTLEADGRVVEPYAQGGSDAIFMAQAGQYTLYISCQGFKYLQQKVTMDAIKPAEVADQRKNKITIFLEPQIR